MLVNSTATEQYLIDAKNFAKEIFEPRSDSKQLGKQPSYYIPGHHYHYNSGPSLLNYFFPARHQHTVHHYHHTESSTKTEKENRDKQSIVVAGVALMASALFMVYSTARECGALATIQTQLDKLGRQHKLVKHEMQDSTSALTAERIHNVMVLHREIMTDSYYNRLGYLTAKGSVLGGLSTLALLCIKTVWLKTSIVEDELLPTVAASALILFGLVSWAYKAGFDSEDETAKFKARELLQYLPS